MRKGKTLTTGQLQKAIETLKEKKPANYYYYPGNSGVLAPFRELDVKKRNV